MTRNIEVFVREMTRTFQEGGTGWGIVAVKSEQRIKRG